MQLRKFRLLLIALLLAMFVSVIGCTEGSTVVESSENNEDIVSMVTLSVSDLQAGESNGASIQAKGMTILSGSDSADYITPIITATTPFNFAVPQWAGDIPEGAEVSVQARTATANGLWTSWQTVVPNPDMTPSEADGSVDEDSNLVVGSMVNAPDSLKTHDRIQIKVNLTPAENGAVPTLERLSVVFVNSTVGPTTKEILSNRDANQKLAQTGNYPRPRIISRNQWCVRSECNYSSVQRWDVSHLILHHTVSNNATTDWAANVRAIWTYHTFTNGWGDVGYNYLIDPNGNIYEGHLGGDNVIGTHARDANRGSMGVALLGTFSTDRPSEPMLAALTELLAWKADQRDIDMWEASRLPLLDWGNLHFAGHRDIYGETACPGAVAHGLIDEVRARVASKINFVPEYAYIDELTAEFSRSNANWHDGPLNCGFNSHANFTYSTSSASASTNSGTWRPNIPTTGLYEVDAFVPYCKTSDADSRQARYTVQHANGTATLTANQSANLGLWMPLGQFNFNAGTSNAIRLSDLTASEDEIPVWFDALRIRPIGVAAFNVSPGDDAWLTDRAMTFSWNINNRSSVDNQRIQVATDASFNNLILNESVPVNQTSLNYTFGEDGKDLYWRVTATDVSGSTLASRATRFHIDSTPPTSQFNSAEKQCDGTYRLRWQATDNLSGIDHYNVTYKAASDAAWTVLLTGTKQTEATFSPPDSNAAYSFRVTAVDGRSNVENKTNADISPAQVINQCNIAPPGIVQPNGTSWLRNRVATFSWSVPSASLIENYKLQIATDEAFGNVVVEKNVSGAASNVSHLFDQDYEQLYWRVIAVTTIRTELTSSSGSFRIDAAAPSSEVFEVVQLPNGNWTLFWRGSDNLSGVASYRVQYQMEGSSNWIDIWSDSTEESAEFTPPDPNKSYRFRSIAKDNAGNIEASKPAGDFNSANACLNSGGATAVLPENGAWTRESQVTFRWNTSSVRCITNMRLDVATDSNFSNLVYSQSVDTQQTSREVIFSSTFTDLYWRVVPTNLQGIEIASETSHVRFDRTAPSSQVVEMRRFSGNRYVVRASGSDAQSGIGGYVFEYRAHNVLEWTVLDGSSGNTIEFIAPDPNTWYWLRSRAIDRVGNMEPEDTAGDLNTKQAIDGLDLYLPIVTQVNQ